MESESNNRNFVKSPGSGKTGYLYINDGWFFQMNKRWVVLSNNCLCSYKKPNITQKPIESFDLSIYNKVEPRSNTKFAIISKLFSRVFVAKSCAQMLHWMIAIHKHQQKNQNNPQIAVFVKISQPLCPIVIDLVWIKVDYKETGDDNQALKKYLNALKPVYEEKDATEIKKEVEIEEHKESNAHAGVKVLEMICCTKKCDIEKSDMMKIMKIAMEKYGVNNIIKCGIEIHIKLGYLEYKPSWNIHDRGLKLIYNDKIATTNNNNFNILESSIDCVDRSTEYDDYKFNATVDGNQSFDTTFNIKVDYLFPKPLSIAEKMNEMYYPTRFLSVSTQCTDNDEMKVNLKVESYKHYVSSTKITCKHMINFRNNDEKQDKSHDLEYQLKCPIYKSMKIDYDLTEDKLTHLMEFTHFHDEYEEKPICRYFEKCRAFVRLEEGDNRLDDRCHMKLYRHPPRGRQIKLAENMNTFAMNENTDDNHGLYCPLTKDKGTLYEKDGYLKQLIKEIINNGYESDLCLNPDDVENKNYSLMIVVDAKMYLQRHILMGCPLNRAEMLSIVLYTGCDCNYDLCSSQRVGDYSKWKWFDLCLWNAICKINKVEKGQFKVYTGLNNVKLNKKSIKNGYFVTYVSTSWKKTVSQKFMGDTGMIIQCDKTFRENVYCCDVSWISKFPDECEVLIARSVAEINSFECKILDENNGIQTISLSTKFSDANMEIESQRDENDHFMRNVLMDPFVHAEKSQQLKPFSIDDLEINNK